MTSHPRSSALATGLALTLVVLGALAAQEPATPPPSVAGVPGTTETRVLVAHAVDLAIGATSTQIAARSVATLPDREKGQGKGALDALREQARKSYENSQKAFEKARESLDRVPGDTQGRELYEAAVGYTKTLWKIAGEAAPVDQKKADTKPEGELNPADMAALQVINNSVKQAASSYLLDQLASRIGGGDNPALQALRKAPVAGASAAKKGSAKFPRVGEESLEKAEKKVLAAKERIEADTDQLKAIKKAKKVSDQSAQQAEAAQSKADKQDKKDASKAKGAAEEAEDKAKQAVKAGEGEGVESDDVKDLAERGRVLILLFDHLTETPAEAVKAKAEKKKETLTPKEFEKKVKSAKKKSDAEDEEIRQGLKKERKDQ